MNNEELGSAQAGNPAVTDVSKPLTVRDTLASDRQKVDEQRRLESESLMLGATVESFKRVQDEWTKRFEAAMKIQDDETPQVVVRKPQTIPTRDLATVYAVRNGKIRPTDANLQSIISSFTSVMTQGKVQGDTTGRSLMTFAKKTDDDRHTIAEGYDVKTNTWTPKATFDALSSMFDRMEMDAAKVEFFRDEKLRRRGMGLGAGESYDRLSHERQLEICNNISGLTDRTWFVNAVDNIMLGLSGRYSDVNGNEIGDKIFDRILNDTTIPASQRKSVDDFIATGAPLNQEEFAKFLYGKGDEYGFGNGALYIGGNGVTERERIESLSKAYGTGINGEFNGGVVVKAPTFDEQVKAVKNDDGTFKHNPIAPLFADLDRIPIPDFDLFDYDNLESSKVNTAIVVVSRGCFYNCTYCGNGNFRKVYPNKKIYARFRSPENATLYLKTLLAKHAYIKFINFRDAIFNMFPDWFDKFIDMYTKEIGLPCTGNIRFDILTEETVKKMKAAGLSRFSNIIGSISDLEKLLFRSTVALSWRR